MHSLLINAIVQQYIKTTRHGDDELMKCFVSMSTAFRTAWHVVEIINTLDIKWNLIPAFDKSQVPSDICNFGEVYHFTQVNIHFSTL